MEVEPGDSDRHLDNYKGPRWGNGGPDGPHKRNRGLCNRNWALFQRSPNSGTKKGHKHAGGNCRIHDLFGGARIFRICNAYFLPKVFFGPQYGNMLDNSLPFGPAQRTTENYLKYLGCPQ